MILIPTLALLLLPLDVQSRKTRSHLSDTLRLKCDALPYRTAYLEYRCYFAVLLEIDYTKAEEQCSLIFPGSKVASTVPSEIFRTMMVEKSKFHLGKDSSGTKQIICTHGSEYKCEADHMMLEEGRCLSRASKKMNFVDANNYCGEQGMELPAPANDLDNRIVRGALDENPAWVQKSNTKENEFKWKQGSNYSRWSTCDAGNKLRSCKKDNAAIIGTTGYWSNRGTESLMDVICITNAANDFTKGVEPCIPYHEMTGLQQLSPASYGLSITCYSPLRTATRYEAIGKATVETQRGCEVLCDSKSKCASFSFKDTGLSSSCVLLSSTTSSQVCSAETTIFKKKKTGCIERTNVTAEFGEDPCIESRNDTAFRGLNVKPICDQDKSLLYVVRAIDVNGRRITLDNERHNFIRKTGNGVFEFVYYEQGSSGGYSTVPNIVAATCAIAEGEKCPCAPLKHLADISDKPNYPATPDRVNPCNSASSYVWWDVAKSPAYGYRWLSQWDTARSFVTCKAGMWILWKESANSNWGVTALSCYI